MAELVLGFLGPAIEVLRYVAAPIKHQFNNLFCFNSNIQNLRDNSQKLDDAKKVLQLQVDIAKDNLQVIVPDVETWLINYEEIKTNKDRILNEVSNVESGIMTAMAHFSLSKRAKRTADQMKELLHHSKFSIISLPPPSAATQALPQQTPIEFESRKYFEEEIMETLRGMDVNMIGIWGMGGVGKTTMAKKIMNRALKNNLFSEVVFVVFGQQADNVRIQVDIGRSLDLDLGNESPQSRAQKLHARLSGSKRILLVLDDIWSSLRLEDLGISCGSSCKILITSRNRDVLSTMDVPICGLPILSDEEAWFLFREKAGICVDATELKQIAEKVVKECKGLPIALTIVGVALKDEKDLSIWEDALVQLTKSNPLDLPDVIAEVYNPLKLSYDFLSESGHARSIFLLCCVFREDYNIPIDHLTWFSMGLRIFEGILGLEETRNRMRTLIKILKNRFLLLDGSDENHVRMHDVVRDVSTFIAAKNGLINCNDCKWISSYVVERPRLSVESVFPNLRLVFVDNRLEPEFQINESFIERAVELNVLFIETSMLRSIPSPLHATHLLKNLVTLVVRDCHSLETISDVSHLVTLEVFVCDDCWPVAEVPFELTALKHLRLLEISHCPISKVAPGLISSLVALEELKMVNSFRKWEGYIEGKERENAGLEELESLSNLRCLEIAVLDCALAAVPLRLSTKLVKFDVEFGDGKYLPCPPKIYQTKFGDGKYLPCPPKIYQTKFLLRARKDNCLGYLPTDPFLRSTEYLHASGNHSTLNMDLANAQNIRWLSLDAFDNMKNITAAGDWSSTSAVFPLLKLLRFADMDSLEEIWKGPIPSNSFKNLKKLNLDNLPRLKQLWRGSPNHNNVVPIFTNLSSIIIHRCHQLRHAFSSANAKDFPLQLKRIELQNCDTMEQLVLLQNVEGRETDLEQGSRISIIFPKLNFLSIQYMPKLTSLCKGIDSIEFPELTKLKIRNFSNMNCLVCPASSDDHNNMRADINHDHYQDLDSSHLFCEPKVSFSNLKELSVWYYL